jgi:hypothetical protein
MRKTALLVVIALVIAGYALFETFRGTTTPTDPTPAPPEEGCTLLGQVLDADGAPLAQAVVRARVVSPGTAHESLSATTGEDGSFALRLFPARGRWTVLVQPAGRSGFTAGTPVTAVPDRTIRITIREPEEPVPEAEPPNLAGEVMDRNGRLLAGNVVIVELADGTVLGRLACPGGKFSGRFETDEKVFVSLESGASGRDFVGPLPQLNVSILPPGRPPETGEMIIDFILPSGLPNDQATIRLYDDLGYQRLQVFRAVREAPHPLIGRRFGLYDVRVDVPGYAGALQGFEFRPDKRVATVALGPAAKVRGTTTREARSLLFSRSPTLAPIGSTITEDDGIAGRYRGLWEEKPAAKAFAFDGLPAGKYRLRFLKPGVETVDRQFELESGQDLDLGLIELTEATGEVTLRIKDREPPDDFSVEYGYLVQFYETGGLCFRQTVKPGSPGEIVFRRVPGGAYRYRVERMIGGTGHTRYVGRDKPVEVKPGAKVKVAVNCLWRY